MRGSFVLFVLPSACGTRQASHLGGKPFGAFLEARVYSVGKGSSLAYTRFMLADRLAEYQDFAASDTWHQRLLTMLDTAGLLVLGEEDAHKPSPVQFVYVAQMLTAAGQQPVGEHCLCFTIAPICSQEKVEALFAPHKAELVSRSFRFRIPLSFFDSH